MNKIEKHADSILNNLRYDINIKCDMRLEFIEHMNLLKDEYIEQGLVQEEAITNAISDFGNGETILSQFTYIKNTKLRILYALGLTIFIVYCTFLILIHLNPLRNTAQWVMYQRNAGHYWSLTVNLIPFKTIINYLININNNNIDIFINNVFGKVILFIPLGLFIPLLFNYTKQIKQFIKVILIVNIIIELLRAIFPLGVSNIDNIIQHTLGSIIGYYLFFLWNKVRCTYLMKKRRLVKSIN